MHCNICQSSAFTLVDREPQCDHCHNYPRHRLLYATLDRYEFLNSDRHFGLSRVLYLAPDYGIHQKLAQVFGTGYYASSLEDNIPERLNLVLPQDFRIFSSNYFDLILHSCVLEHLPGQYRQHLAEFQRILKPNGTMIFNIPFDYAQPVTSRTVEGGEFLATDQERIQLHTEPDHYKTFGYDFLAEMHRLQGRHTIEKFTLEQRTDINACVPTNIHVFVKS